MKFFFSRVLNIGVGDQSFGNGLFILLILLEMIVLRLVKFGSFVSVINRFWIYVPGGVLRVS